MNWMTKITKCYFVGLGKQVQWNLCKLTPLYSEIMHKPTKNEARITFVYEY